ncbi:hypothetical protein NE237_031515 [Protea cynaroides]|uniref:Uncharacterized protein n=1 Tax=Protea cynaroides TaxID=273540 RepID=A0A9Q0L1B6_9MAGN|nr:hypothetical protein NE237_031515 [Protea cynaroides]
MPMPSITSNYDHHVVDAIDAIHPPILPIRPASLCLVLPIHPYAHPPPVSQHATRRSLIDRNPEQLKQRDQQLARMLVVEDQWLKQELYLLHFILNSLLHKEEKVLF